MGLNIRKKVQESEQKKLNQKRLEQNQMELETKQSRKRSRKRPGNGSRLNKRDLLLTAGIIAVAAVVIVLTLQFRKGVDTVSVSDGAYQYFGEEKLAYTGKTTLHYEDGQTTLKDSTGEHVLDNKPLYENDSQLILPVTYAWYDINSGWIYRLEHFSTVSLEGNQIVLKDGSKKKEGAGGFTYDGQNTYLFLERVEITVGDQAVDLPAMSYVVAQYNSSLQYYAAGSGESVVLQAEGKDQTARFGNGDVLNLGTDTLNKANGSWQLLVADPSLMDRMD